VTVSTDEWISVLKVSTLWRCSSLRKLAIRKISWSGVHDLNAWQKIALGRKYCVPSWVEGGYKWIVAKRNIPDERVEEIGVLESFKLLRIIISQNYSPPDNEIKKVFHEELESIAAAEEAILNP